MVLKPALEIFADRLASLAPLSSDDLAAIRDLRGDVFQARANVDIVSPGQVVDHVCLIVDGLAARFGQLSDGGRQITALHINGDMADLHAVATPLAASAIQALTSTALIRIPTRQLRDLAARSPALLQAFWAYSAVDAAVLARWTVNLGRRDAQGRLAHLVCEMALRFDNAGLGSRDRFMLEATQSQLADALGLTSVHISRTFKALRQAGVLSISDRTMTILNWEKLVAMGDFDPDYLQIGPMKRRAA